jgi:hypothetical protein
MSVCVLRAKSCLPYLAFRRHGSGQLADEDLLNAPLDLLVERVLLVGQVDGSGAIAQSRLDALTQLLAVHAAAFHLLVRQHRVHALVNLFGGNVVDEAQQLLGVLRQVLVVLALLSPFGVG